MARSFVYERPMDAQILPVTEISNHEFQFNTLKVKKEVEHDSFDMEIGLSSETIATRPNDPTIDQNSVLQSTNISNQYVESNGAVQPKLVIKFRDLWKKSERAIDFSRKKERSNGMKLKNKSLTAYKLRGKVRHKFESSALSTDRITRSASLMSNDSDSNGNTTSTRNCLQRAAVCNTESKKDVWTFAPITRLRKNLNMSCESCGMCFKSDKRLQAHKRFYATNGKFLCTSCDVRFSHKFQLSRHVKAHSTIDDGNHYKFKCAFCVDHFEKEASLIAHITHLHNTHVVAHKKSVNSGKERVSISISCARRKKRKKKTRAEKTKQVVPIVSNNKETMSDSNPRSSKNLKQQSIRSWCHQVEPLMYDNSQMQQNDNSPGNVITDNDLDDNIKKPRSHLIKKNRTTKRLQVPSERRSQMLPRNQTRSQILPDFVKSEIERDLGDHLGNRMDNHTLSEPFDLPHKTDHIFGCTTTSTKLDLTDSNMGTKISDTVRCTRSTTIKATKLNSLTINIMDTAKISEQKLMQKEDLNVQERGINATGENYMISKAQPHLADVSESLILLQHEEIDRQVGPVSSHHISRALMPARKMVNAVRACNNFDSSQVDDFGKSCESNLMKSEHDGISDSDCESISLKMTASSSNVSLTDSLSLKTDNVVTTPPNSDPLIQPDIKDVRVVLVKLENMLEFSTTNSPPGSSLLENYSLVKTETSDYISRDTRLTDKRKRVPTNHYRKALSNKSRSRKQLKSRQAAETILEKCCYLCSEVFQNNFSAASHYLSVHNNVGVFQCRLCHSSFENLRNLRHHLCTHYTDFDASSLNIFCIVCKKELSNSCLKRLCLECDQTSEIKQYNLRGKKFPNTQDLTEHRSAHMQASEKICTSVNRSLSSHKISTVSMSEKTAQHDASVVDHESAKNDVKIVSPRTYKKSSKTFKCFTCNRVFLKGSLLKWHVITAHASVKNRKRKKRQNIIGSQILSHSTSPGSKKILSNRRESRSNSSRFSIKKTKNPNLKNINFHDKFCEKSSARSMLRFPQINKKQHFIRQRRVHGNKTTYYNHKCNRCGLKCCCRRNLEIHQKRYSTNGNNLCNICGLTFAWKRLFVKHMQIAHNPEILFYGKTRCKFCNHGFYTKKFLKIHLAHFHNKKYIQYKICRSRFDNRGSFDSHTRDYSENVSNRCGICGQLFKCKYMLEYHEARDHNLKELKAYKYFCNLCNCAFFNKLLLQAHIGHFHNMRNPDAKINANNGDMNKATVHHCDGIQFLGKAGGSCINSNITTNNLTIREHVNEVYRTEGIAKDVVHKTNRKYTPSEYKCGICKLNFNDPCAILNHEWEFSNEGIHTCHVCDRKFMTSSLLKHHILKHQGNVIGDYKCYICYEDFSKPDHLKMHGLHLHGPQFVWEKYFETVDTHALNSLELHKNPDHDDILNKLTADDTYKTIGLMASDDLAKNDNILLFQKIGNSTSYMEEVRRSLKDNAWNCNFCKKSFSSASLLDNHIKKHAYRAYYTNSSRYLCLICKNKFRTNDILRAHVIYSHTSDENEPNLSESGCSKVSDPGEPIKSQIHIINEKTDMYKNYNKTENVVEILPSKPVSCKHPSNSGKRNSVSRSDGSTVNKIRKFNPTNNVKICQTNPDHGRLISQELECRKDDDLQRNDLNGDEDRSSSSSKSVESGQSGITYVGSDPTPEEVQLFAVKVEDMKGSGEYMCIICIAPFHSVSQFKEHFASTHVKNGEYLCTYCGENFPIMLDLKYHIRKHEKELKNLICYDKKLLINTNLVCHKLSHDEQTEETRNKLNIHNQLLPILNVNPPKKSDDKPGVKSGVNSCKCEICNERFSDFETMLTHWDACIDKNGLRCDLCSFTFRRLNFFREHKKTCREKKRKSNIVQNGRSFRINSEQTIQASIFSSNAQGNEFGDKINCDNSMNANATAKLDRIATSTNKFSEQNKSSNYGNTRVKSFSQILQNSKNNSERGVNGHQQNKTNGVTTPRPEFESNKGMQLSKQQGMSKIIQKNVSIENDAKSPPLGIKDNATTQCSRVSRLVKTITQCFDSEEEVSKNIESNASKKRSLYHLPVQNSNNNIKQNFQTNDFGLKCQQNECKQPRPATPQLNSLTISSNSTSSQFTTHKSINIGNASVASSKSGQQSQSNDREDKRRLDPLLASSNTIRNRDDHSYTRPAADALDNIMNDATLVGSDSGKTSQPNANSGNIVSSLVPISSNPCVSSTSFLSVKPTSNTSFAYNTQTVLQNDSKFKSLNESIANKLSTTLQKSSSVINPIHASNIQHRANDSNSKSNQNVTLNDSIIPSCSSYSKDTRVPMTPAIASSSTSGNPSISHGNVTKDNKISVDKSASTKQLVLKKQVVRCSFCNLLFSEKLKLIKHMESHKIDNQCPVCGLTFSNESAFQHHLSEHRYSTCTECKITFFFSDSIPLSKEMQKYCSVCNNLLPLPVRKPSHYTIDSARHVVKCGICMNTFGTIGEMTVHFKLVHSSLVCGICESKFITKTSLHKHMRTHDITIFDIHQCKVCEKYFIDQSDLAKHILSH